MQVRRLTQDALIEIQLELTFAIQSALLSPWCSSHGKFVESREGIHSRKLTCSPLKDAGWETILSFQRGPAYFHGLCRLCVSFRECIWQRKQLKTKRVDHPQEHMFFFKDLGFKGSWWVYSVLFCCWPISAFVWVFFFHESFLLPFALKKMWWCGAFMVKKIFILYQICTNEIPHPKKKETSTEHISIPDMVNHSRLGNFHLSSVD